MSDSRDINDHSSTAEEFDNSPQTQDRLINDARWKDARQDKIEDLRTKQIPDEYAAVSEFSPRMAAVHDRTTRTARRSLDQPSRSIPIAFIYLRVSTKEQARRGGTAEGYSIPTQRAASIAKAEQLGATTVEYLDAGESARSADRDDLQRMLRDVKRVRPDYVIVHKIDRLARNREDDIAINLLLRRHGVKLVSCMENIDDSPSGKLLYGLMAEIAQFYSSNLAQEVMKGLLTKAELGGTPYRAPLGYRNRRETVDGFERAWVEVDEGRAEIIRWCFLEYVTGDWSVADLTLEAQTKGLMSRATATKPSRPVALTTMHHILQNPYYMGLVPYQGIHYEGKHVPLVEPEIWLGVQDMLASRNHAGEKERTHLHYLRSTIYCSLCGGRLVYSENKGNGGTYLYYFCVKKKTKANNCTRKAVRVERIEEGVEHFYNAFQIKAEHVDLIRSGVLAELAAQRDEAERSTQRATRRRHQLDDERQKLLRAHYAGVIPEDLLGSEMQRFTRESAAIDRELKTARAVSSHVADTLTAALAAAEHCQRAYITAPPHVRRQINQGFFKKLFIGEDGSMERAEVNEPFAALLAPEQWVGSPTQHAQDEGLAAPDVARGGLEVIVEAEGVDLRSSVVLRAVPAEDTSITQCVGTNTHRKMDLAGRGVNKHYVVGAAGFEPATARV